MSFRRLSRYIKVVFVSLVAALALCLPGHSVSEAAGTVVFSVSGPAQPVNPGGQFTININIQPSAAIAGAQFNLAFNPSLVAVKGISEGTLLKQNGANTYFTAGRVDNVTGTITGVAGTIINPGASVSAPVLFVVITMTAAKAGTCPLTISNAIAGDTNAQQVPVSMVNGNITVGTITEPPILNGGGGGGGGGGSGATYTPPATTTINTARSVGTFNETTTIKSDDGSAKEVINQGSRGLTRDGKVINEITIAAVPSPSPQMTSSNVVGTIYNIGPDGTTFDNPVSLTLNYNPSLIPEGLGENNLSVATWDTSLSKWTMLESTVDSKDLTITGKVNHFSIFAVCVSVKPASFEVSNLSTLPTEVHVDDSVGVSAIITNSGDLKDSFEAALKMDDVEIGKQIVTVAGNLNQIVKFNINPTSPGTHILSIGNLSAKLVVKEPAKASFVAGNLNISKTQINAGETVTVSALVTNSGNASGTYTVVLKIDGNIDQQKEIALDTGISREVSFEVLELNPGNYLAEVNGLSIPFVINESLPAPAVSLKPTVTEFSLSLLAEVIGGAFVLISVTAFILILRRRQLLKKEQT